MKRRNFLKLTAAGLTIAVIPSLSGGVESVVEHGDCFIKDGLAAAFIWKPKLGNQYRARLTHFAPPINNVVFEVSGKSTRLEWDKLQSTVIGKLEHVGVDRAEMMPITDALFTELKRLVA